MSEEQGENGADPGAPAPGLPPDPLVGTLIADRFRVLSLVARGGMGKIYKAEQVPLGRVVALKVLAPTEIEADDGPAFERRFEREASICSRLNHSNTVRIFDFGRTREGLFYIAMEYVVGRTLQHAIRQEAPMPAATVLHVLRQVAGSLAEAHDRGIIHRDLKPANVLLTTQGDDRNFAKVVDFGLVKHILDRDVTEVGLIVGSPMYMAPEQVRGENVDQRADVYALGMMGYVMLTGRRPFERETPVATLMARMANPPPPMRDIAPGVDVPASLDWVVMTCLAIDRRSRFSSMQEVLRALRVCEAEIEGAAPGPFTLSLAEGRTVLPAEFSDVSAVRTRTASSGPPTADPTLFLRAPAAGVSIALAALLGGAVFVVLLLALAGAWFLVSGRGSTSAPAPVTASAPATPVPASASPASPPAVPDTHGASTTPATASPEAPTAATEPPGATTAASSAKAPPASATKPPATPTSAPPRAPAGTTRSGTATRARPSGADRPTEAPPAAAPAPASTSPTPPATQPPPAEKPDAWKTSEIRNPFGK